MARGFMRCAARCATARGWRAPWETPALVGKFVAERGGRPVRDLFDYVSRAMPQPAPGSLSPEDNARVVAYLLQANRAPDGNRMLSADAAALRRIGFDATNPRQKRAAAGRLRNRARHEGTCRHRGES